MLPSNPALVSVLGVTLIVNLFHFSYFPIVTVIAQRVFASPFLTGLLAAPLASEWRRELWRSLSFSHPAAGSM